MGRIQIGTVYQPVPQPTEQVPRAADHVRGHDRDVQGRLHGRRLEVPPAAVELLVKMPVVTTSGTFELRRGEASGTVSSRFYSPDAEKTAGMLAARLSRRMVDAGSNNVDECSVS